MVNSSQSSSMSFAYVATPGGKESLQSFGIAVAMFSEGGVVGVGIAFSVGVVVWYAFVTCICNYGAQDQFWP